MYMQLCSNSQRSKIMIDGDDELMMMPQHQNHGNPPPNSAAVASIRSPQNHRLPSPSLVSLEAPCRVRLADILPYDGAPVPPYLRAVDALSASLMRHNAAVIELGSDDAALLRCALESTRLYFRIKKGGRDREVYTYRAGRPLEDIDSSPPCMADIFRCMGKVARAALCAIARNLRLRSDVFNHLLDDTPLPASDPSSSVLVATFSQISSQQGKSATVGGKLTSSCEVEKGLLMLISCDAPGLQVCDPNGRWYQADGSLSPGDLLLLTGKALSHATAGLRPAASYRVISDNLVISPSSGRTSLAFRLMPQSNAILDCTPVAAAGHVIPQSYMPISVSQFMDDLSVEEDVSYNHTDYVPADNMNREPSLRSVLSDPLSGAFLEDAMQVSCGHSFGGLMLRRVLETSKCTLCNAEIDSGSLIPNHALRAAALAAKQEDDRRLFHNAALRKRRKEANEHRENGDIALENGSHRGVQYPFSVLEKVTIKGNKRTPDKFVGKEAVITSQCLNGWYLLRITETGENVRLQYRSLRKNQSSNDSEDSCAFLEDAMQVSCGHSFGGHMLRRVLETSKCTVCNADIDSGSLIPNHALRAAALAAKQEDDRRLFRNAALRKRRKEANAHRENGDITLENGSHRGVQYPFSVNEKVTIKGNRRTPDKFVGKEAVITSQCLNGWYLLRIIETGENVRLQYRSLRKNLSSNDSEDRCVSEPGQSSS